MNALVIPGESGPIVVARASATLNDATSLDPGPGAKSADVALSGADLHVKCTGSGAVQGRTARSRVSCSGYVHSELKYFEFKVTAYSGNTSTIGVGFVNSVFVPDAGVFIGEDYNGCGYYGDGNIYINNSIIASPGVFVTGDIVSVAVAILKDIYFLVWFRVNGGLWNNDSGADPATNTGGIDVGTMVYSPPNYTAGNLFAAVAVEELNDEATINFGQVPFTYTPPTNFNVWSDSAATVLDRTTASANLQWVSPWEIRGLFNFDSSNVRSLTRQATGKYYCEATSIYQQASYEVLVGVCNVAFTLTSTQPDGPDSSNFTTDGFIYGTDGSFDTGLPFVQGDRIGVEIDATARTMRVRVNGSAWCSPYDISLITGDLYFLAGIYGISAQPQVKVNFGDTPYVDAPPTNAKNWNQRVAEFNPNDTIPLGFVTNNNLTFHVDLFTDIAGLCRSTAHHATGKYYCEITLDAFYQYKTAIGVCNSSLPMDWSVDDDTMEAMLWPYDGNIYNHNTSILAGPTAVNLDIISFEIDATNRTMRFRVNGGSWSGLADISYILGDLYFVAYVDSDSFGSSNQVTLNFGATAYAYAPPPGARNW